MNESYDLEAYEEYIYRCIRCGFCKAVCPVLHEEDMNEVVGPRSFVLTAKGIITGDLKPSLRMAEMLYQCLECGACNIKCPPGVKIEEIIRATRQRLIESGIQPPQNIHPIIDSVGNQGRLYTSKKVDEPIRNFQLNVPRKEEADILYYIGCAASHLEQGQAKAMIQILHKSKVDFTVLKEEACCGLPLYIYGYKDLFDERVKKNMEMFKQANFSTIVTTCPGCYRAFSKLYPRNPPFTILHSSQLIMSLIENGDIKLLKHIHKKITYHDPCDLGRHTDLFDTPRSIIKSIPNVEFVEAIRNRMDAQCCGAGAGFASSYPEIAKGICANRLKSDIEPTGSEILVTSCPNCTHHFKETVYSIKDYNLEKIKIADLTELVAQTLES